MQNFRTYQLALALANQCKHLHLKHPYKDQFERAVLSIALNLAEGSAKPTAKDQKRFYFVALGSLREVQALIALLDLSHLEKQADTLGAHIFKLANH